MNIIEEEITKYFLENQTFYLPKEIISNTNGYEKIFLMRKSVLESGAINITISFKNVTYFEPCLCSVLGAIFEEFERKYKNVRYTEIYELMQKDNRLVKNSFIPRLFNINKTTFIKKELKEISYKKFSNAESEKYNNYIKEF